MSLIESIRAEYVRYMALAEGAIAQVTDAELVTAAAGGGNSIAVIVQHLAGNFRSRFTDFLTSDGEKPWRQREEEFAAREVSRDQLLAMWQEGWRVLFAALDGLDDGYLARQVTIRGQALSVHEALHRSLAHAAYHVGQIVLLAKSFRGADWKYLSIAPGDSAAYNAAPTRDRPTAHADAITATPSAGDTTAPR